MKHSVIKIPAPAKINLFLHICGRRPDGYHNLQTVFQFIDYSDEITLELREDGQINLLTPIQGIPDQENLIIKAANAVKDISGTALGADISISKKLPMGGGIGGGSSDAASTIVGLDYLWQTNADNESLKQIGAKLGADVPVFIHGHSAWAEGIGEVLTDIDIEEPWYVLLIPQCHVPTARIFSHSNLTRDSKMLKIAAFLEQGNSGVFGNDCENLVRELYPKVDKALNTLSNFGNARLTGTGACVFTRFPTENEAKEVYNKLSATEEEFQTILCRGINRSPLYNALEALN